MLKMMLIKNALREFEDRMTNAHKKEIQHAKIKLPPSYLHTSDISLFCQAYQIPKRSKIEKTVASAICVIYVANWQHTLRPAVKAYV